MKLIELVRKAHAGYVHGFPESGLLEFVNRRTGRPLPPERQPGGDTLALFVVRELADTFDPEASDGEQVGEAIRVIAAAIGNLENAVAALEPAGL